MTTIGQVSGSSAGMVSKQTGKVEKASSVTIAAGRMENAMLGFRERHAAAARPAASHQSQRPREDCRRVLELAIVLVGPRGFADRERQVVRDRRLGVDLQGLQDPAPTTARVSISEHRKNTFRLDDITCDVN